MPFGGKKEKEFGMVCFGVTWSSVGESGLEPALPWEAWELGWRPSNMVARVARTRIDVSEIGGDSRERCLKKEDWVPSRGAQVRIRIFEKGFVLGASHGDFLLLLLLKERRGELSVVCSVP